MEFKLFVVGFLIFILGSTGAGVFILAVKWGVIEWYQVNRRKWMPAFCGVFCYSFWFVICPLFSALMLYIPFDYVYLLSLLPAAALARLFVDERD